MMRPDPHSIGVALWRSEDAARVQAEAENAERLHQQPDDRQPYVVKAAWITHGGTKTFIGYAIIRMVE